MIKSLQLHNFQSHKHTELEFDPGVNVIVGPSDSGKTAIIRALRWLVWNRPQGDGMRSKWGGETSVQVILDMEDYRDDATIVRGKDKEELYQLDETIFKAFKTEVPTEIIQTLNLNEINLQQQLDSPFMLSNSPGEVAQHFNRVARLDKIDTGLQNVQRQIRELTQDITYKTQLQEQAKKELEQFAHLDKFEAEVEVLEDMSRRLTVKRSNLAKLSDLTDDLTQTGISIQTQKETLKIEPVLNKILDCINDKKLVEEKQGKLSKLVQNITKTSQQMETAELNHKTLQRRFKDVFPNICPLCGQEVKK